LSANYSNLRQPVTLWLFLTIAASMMICPPAWGHGVNVFAYVDGQKIFVEGYFSGKSKAVDSVVEVFDAQGNKLHEGKTNNNGVYSFKVLEVVPVRGDLRIVLKAGPEHQAEFRLPAADLPAYPKRKAAVVETQKEPQSQDMNLSESRTAEASYDQVLLKRLVEEAVDGKIQPLATMLSQQQKLLMELNEKRLSLTEIVGGIGWILGIVGVAAYLMSRRNMGKP
jgi:nickel transport protein